MIKNVYERRQGEEEGLGENRLKNKFIGKIYVRELKWFEIVVRELEVNVSRVANYLG